MVDLHGLHVAEAVEYAKLELQSATYRNDDTVSFIVGMSVFQQDLCTPLRAYVLGSTPRQRVARRKRCVETSASIGRTL